MLIYVRTLPLNEIKIQQNWIKRLPQKKKKHFINIYYVAIK